MEEAADTAAILPTGGGGHGEREEEEDEEDASRPPCGCRRRGCVEPLLFLCMLAVALQAPLVTQYVWDRLADDLRYNGSHSAACSPGGASDPLRQEVEALAAAWSVYLGVAGFSVGLLVVPLLGSWSDLAGRRPVLVVPSLGLALQAGVYLLVMYLKLPLAYLLLGRLLSGLTGDFAAILAGCFAYVADTSDRGSRTFRVAVLEACLGVSGMLASVVGGQWKRAQGYVNPFWLALASSLTAALYAFLCVPESVHPDPSARLLTTRHHRAALQLLWKGGGAAEGELRSSRYRLWLYLLSFFVVVSVHSGTRDLSVLYQLSAPLCWGAVLLGFGSAAQHLAYLTSLGGLRLLQRWLEDSWVALLGLASNALGLLVLSMADSTALVFTGYGLSFLLMTVTPVLRSKLSKLAAPSQQGALFATVACVETLCFLVGSSLFNSLYAAMLPYMRGFPFLLGALLLLVPAGIIGGLHYVDLREARRDPAPS